MSSYLTFSPKSGRSNPLGGNHVQWYVLEIVFNVSEHSVDFDSSTSIPSKSQTYLSQQADCEASTGFIARTQPGKCSSHDQRLNDDKVVQEFTSNNNHASQINSGNSDEKADTTSFAVEHHHSLASSMEDAPLLVGIGSQFEEVALQNTPNIEEVSLGKDFTSVEPVHCLDTTSGGVQRGPMER
jgi:hypothetical protein